MVLSLKWAAKGINKDLIDWLEADLFIRKLN